MPRTTSVWAHHVRYLPQPRGAILMKMLESTRTGTSSGRRRRQRESPGLGMNEAWVTATGAGHGSVGSPKSFVCRRKTITRCGLSP